MIATDNRETATTEPTRDPLAQAEADIALMDARIAAARARAAQPAPAGPARPTVKPTVLAARVVAEYAVEWLDDLGDWHLLTGGTRTIARATQPTLDLLVDSLLRAHRRRKQTVRASAVVKWPSGAGHLLAYDVIEPMNQRNDADAA